MLCRIVEQSGRPLSFSLAQHARAPGRWRHLLDRLTGATSRGLPMRAQVCGRPVGLLFGLELTLNPFSKHPSYVAVEKLPLAERVRRLQDPEFRARLLGEDTTAEGGFLANISRRWPVMFLMGEEPDYEQPFNRAVGAIAVERGVSPEEVALDHLLSRGGRGMLYLPFLNYAEGSLDACYEMLTHRDTVIGLSDGGAHVGMICDGSFPTFMLTHWTRDRSRGERLSVPWVVKAQSADTARAVGLHDRGLLAPGYRADINLIDYDALTLPAPELVDSDGKPLQARASTSR